MACVAVSADNAWLLHKQKNINLSSVASALLPNGKETLNACFLLELRGVSFRRTRHLALGEVDMKSAVEIKWCLIRLFPVRVLKKMTYIAMIAMLLL